MENPSHASRVKEWSDQGHEIGNHSWSHPVNLGALPKTKIYDEVIRSHDIIFKVTGKEPRGFIAPAWSSSTKLFEILIDQKYFYDSSVFPSMLLYPLTIRMAINRWKICSRPIEALQRGDWLTPLNKPRLPFSVNRKGNVVDIGQSDSLLVLPLPTTKYTRIAIWHTVGFLFGWDFLHSNISKLLKEHPGFYHLIHPADFLCSSDLDQDQSHALHRMDERLETKLTQLEKVFSLLDQSERPVVTLNEIAEFHIQKGQSGKNK